LWGEQPRGGSTPLRRIKRADAGLLSRRCRFASLSHARRPPCVHNCSGSSSPLASPWISSSAASMRSASARTSRAIVAWSGTWLAQNESRSSSSIASIRNQARRPRRASRESPVAAGVIARGRSSGSSGPSPQLHPANGRNAGRFMRQPRVNAEVSAAVSLRISSDFEARGFPCIRLR
jgi:hypothetical protein